MGDLKDSEYYKLNRTACGMIFQHQHFWCIECNPSGPPLFSCSKVWHSHLDWIYWRMAWHTNSQSLRRNQVCCKRSVISLLIFTSRCSPLTDLGLSESLHAEISPLGLHSIYFKPGYFRTSFLAQDHRSPHNPGIEDYAKMTRQVNNGLVGFLPFCVFT